MELSPTDIARIRRSWAAVAANPRMAGELFYGRLFSLAPETRALFRSDMAAQGKKLTDTLGFVVDHLDAPGPLVEEAAALARRHVAYGVRAEHYAPVGAALLWTLERMLGPAMDAETRAAWTAAYAALSETMIAAAHPDGAA